MKQNTKYIGINQPIPYKVLDEAIYCYLTNEPLNTSALKALLTEYVQGKVRLDKGATHINVLLSKNDDILCKIKKEFKIEQYLNLTDTDRTCLFLCLLALAFPVTYDLLNILAVGFKVQSKINRSYIDSKISKLYGSNRGVINAVKALMQMLVEYQIVTREKVGTYTFTGTKEINNKAINELMVYTDIKLSGSKSILVDDLDFRPWYLYFKATFNSKEKRFLFREVESRIGQGYLTI